MAERVWIGVDGNEGNVAQRVGSNVYAFELLKHLAERVEQKGCRLAVRVFLAQAPLPDWPPETEFWKYTVLGDAPLWTVTKLPRALKNWPELKLFFSPGHYTPAWSPVPVVCSIMDLGYEHFPGQFKTRDLWQLRLMTGRSLRQAKHVVVISRATKQDVIARHRLPASKLSVIYPGLPDTHLLTKKEAEARRQALEVPENYILYLGTLQPRKNLIRLIQAFEILAPKHPQLHLVVAGRAGWLSDPIVAALQHSPFADRIKHLGFVTQEDKLAVLQGARVLAMVGLLEGFGIPPLEAVQAGVVPVVSNTASLPEVVGPEGELVDPFSVDSIAQGLEEVLQWSQARYARELDELRRHTAQFSWTDSAARLEQLLVNLVGAESQ